MQSAQHRIRLQTIRTRPGLNILLNLPIIIILHLSPLFKRKLPTILKKADKIQMKYEYVCDQNIATCTFWPTSARLHANFLFNVNSEAKETFSTPKNDR